MQVLHETQLVETFNLRAAIEYQLKNCMLLLYLQCYNLVIKLSLSMPVTVEAAQDALTDMPPRAEEVCIGDLGTLLLFLVLCIYLPM